MKSKRRKSRSTTKKQTKKIRHKKVIFLRRKANKNILRNKTKNQSAHFSTVTTKTVTYGLLSELKSMAGIIIKMAINQSTLSVTVKINVVSA